jgi:hypothetical protein
MNPKGTYILIRAMPDERTTLLGLRCRFCGNIIAMVPPEWRLDEISVRCDQCGRRGIYAHNEAFSLPPASRKQKREEGSVAFGRRKRQ